MPKPKEEWTWFCVEHVRRCDVEDTKVHRAQDILGYEDWYRIRQAERYPRFSDRTIRWYRVYGDRRVLP